jgi:hypothetical protein
VVLGVHVLATGSVGDEMVSVFEIAVQAVVGLVGQEVRSQRQTGVQHVQGMQQAGCDVG